MFRFSLPVASVTKRNSEFVMIRPVLFRNTRLLVVLLRVYDQNRRMVYASDAGAERVSVFHQCNASCRQ